MGKQHGTIELLIDVNKLPQGKSYYDAIQEIKDHCADFAKETDVSVNMNEVDIMLIDTEHEVHKILLSRLSHQAYITVKNHRFDPEK